MSQENVEVVRGVRTPVAVPKARPRSPDERILVRFPALVRVAAAVWSRLPPRSRLRQAWTSRIVRQGCGAANRRDWEVLVLLLDPAIELHIGRRDSGFIPPDMLGVHHGHEGYLRVWETMLEAYGDAKLEHEEVIDFGDRLLAVGRFTGHATFSGIPLNEPIFQVVTMRRGLVIRQDDLATREQALEAAGLRE